MYIILCVCVVLCCVVCVCVFELDSTSHRACATGRFIPFPGWSEVEGGMGCGVRERERERLAAALIMNIDWFCCIISIFCSGGIRTLFVPLSPDLGSTTLATAISDIMDSTWAPPSISCRDLVSSDTTSLRKMLRKMCWHHPSVV